MLYNTCILKHTHALGTARAFHMLTLVLNTRVMSTWHKLEVLLTPRPAVPEEKSKFIL
jgi:hypothetical protein